MRTEGTTGVADRSLDWDGDVITTVLLEGVGGGREDCRALVCEAAEGHARPWVGVVVWRGGGQVLGAEGFWGATLGGGPGATFTGPEGAIPFFFFFGADTRLRAIRFPNTTRASLSCLSVPRIETRCSERLSTSWVKAETRALDMSVTCFRPRPPHPTTCPIRSSVMTKEAEKRSGENFLGWWAERGAATGLLAVAREECKGHAWWGTQSHCNIVKQAS